MIEGLSGHPIEPVAWFQRNFYLECGGLDAALVSPCESGRFRGDDANGVCSPPWRNPPREQLLSGKVTIPQAEYTTDFDFERLASTGSGGLSFGGGGGTGASRTAAPPRPSRAPLPPANVTVNKPEAVRLSDSRIRELLPVSAQGFSRPHRLAARQRPKQ